MNDGNPAGRGNGRQSDRSIDRDCESGYGTDSVKRIPDDSVDEAATLVQYLQTAQEFDDAEAHEEYYEPTGKPTTGGQKYLVQGDTDDEWLETNYVIAAGDER